jgi:hypothetical protein
MSSRLDRQTIDITLRQHLFNIFSGSFGNLVEYFDWANFAAFALFIMD